MKKSKKLWLKLTAGILTMAGTVTALAACNNTTTNQPDNPSPVDPNPPEQTISVSLIYDGIGVSMDTKAMLQTEVNQIAENVYGDADVKAYGLKDDDLQVISMVGDELSSVVVSLPQETIDYLKGDVKDSVLSKAGLTPQQEVKESEKSQIVEKISNAVDYIESKIGAISDLPVGNVNYYTKGEATENADKTFSVIGPVLEDGTFQIFDISTNGDLYETIISVPGSANKTPEQIYQDYYNGNYIASASKLIDLNSTYTAPKPIDPENPGEVEDEISFEEIYNQVFGEGFVVADAQSLLNDLAERVFINTTDVKVIAVDTNDCFTIYSQNVDALGRTRLTKGAYKGAYLEEITSYLSLLQQIKNAGGWDEYINSFAPSGSIEEGSETHNKLLATFENIKSTLSNEKIILNTQRSDFSTETVINATREELPASSNAFGEALLGNMGEKGTIIATYVGDMGLRLIDSTGMFNTGYYCSYDLVVVYSVGDSIFIQQTAILNEWSNSSTNDSIYSYLINNEEAKYIVKEKNEIILNNVNVTMNYKNLEDQNSLQR